MADEPFNLIKEHGEEVVIVRVVAGSGTGRCVEIGRWIEIGQQL
jgi:hypothetical protein